jgi:hypothetical protein
MLFAIKIGAGDGPRMEVGLKVGAEVGVGLVAGVDSDDFQNIYYSC